LIIDALGLGTERRAKIPGNLPRVQVYVAIGGDCYTRQVLNL